MDGSNTNDGKENQNEIRRFASGTAAWQKRLLPFLITVISVLAVGFMIFYFLQINKIQDSMDNSMAIQVPATIQAESTETKKWNDLVYLESAALNKRYFHAQMVIRTRILILSLSFLTGMTLSIIGALFILGKFVEEPFSLEGAIEKTNIKLLSSSPGILLTFFGIVLICISIFARTELTVLDTPIYFPGKGDRETKAKKKSLEPVSSDTIRKKADSLLREVSPSLQFSAGVPYAS